MRYEGIVSLAIFERGYQGLDLTVSTLDTHGNENVEIDRSFIIYRIKILQMHG